MTTEDLARELEQLTDPSGGTARKLDDFEAVRVNVATLRAAAARLRELEEAIRYEQNRAGRIGTHGPDCHTWGPQHYECAVRRIGELEAALKPFGEASRDCDDPDIHDGVTAWESPEAMHVCIRDFRRAAQLTETSREP